MPTSTKLPHTMKIRNFPKIWKSKINQTVHYNFKWKIVWPFSIPHSNHWNKLAFWSTLWDTVESANARYTVNTISDLMAAKTMRPKSNWPDHHSPWCMQICTKTMQWPTKPDWTIREKNFPAVLSHSTVDWSDKCRKWLLILNRLISSMRSLQLPGNLIVINLDFLKFQIEHTGWILISLPR